jgi:hypothetical protein
MEEVKVSLKDGEVVLRKPNAGMRNAALIKAETPEGLKRSVMMVELLPACVKAHPWGMRPVKDALNSLSIDEYDKLIDALEEMMKPTDDIKKKSTEESDQEEKEKTG